MSLNATLAYINLNLHKMFKNKQLDGRMVTLFAQNLTLLAYISNRHYSTEIKILDISFAFATKKIDEQDAKTEHVAHSLCTFQHTHISIHSSFHIRIYFIRIARLKFSKF